MSSTLGDAFLMTNANVKNEWKDSMSFRLTSIVVQNYFRTEVFFADCREIFASPESSQYERNEWKCAPMGVGLRPCITWLVNSYRWKTFSDFEIMSHHLSILHGLHLFSTLIGFTVKNFSCYFSEHLFLHLLNKCN